MSSRPEAAMCLRNSSSTSSLPAACSQVAEPTWMRIRSPAARRRRVSSALLTSTSNCSETLSHGIPNRLLRVRSINA